MSFLTKKILLIVFSIPSFCFGIIILSGILFDLNKAGTDTTIIMNKSITFVRRNPIKGWYKSYGIQSQVGHTYGVDKGFYDLARIGDSLKIDREIGFYRPLHLTLIRRGKVLDSFDCYGYGSNQPIFTFLLPLILLFPMLGAIFLKDLQGGWFKTIVFINVIVVSLGAILFCVSKMIK